MRKSTILIYVAVAAIIVVPYVAAGWSELPIDDYFRQQAPGEFVQITNGKIHYRWLGSQSGEIIVLVHGVSVPQYVFSQTAAALVESGYRILLFDHFGHGYSDRPVAQYDADFFDLEMVEVLNELGLHDPVNLGALSMGGVIAADFTARHPERVKTLTQFAPAGLRLVNDSDSALVSLMKSPVFGNWLWRIVARDFYFPEDDDNTAVEDIVSDESMQGVPERQADYEGYLMAQRQIFRNLRLSHRDDLLSTIAATSVPVLGIFGDADDTVSLDSAALLADLIPRARVEVISGGTHHLNIHRWREVRDLMLSFLRNNAAIGLPAEGPTE